MFFTLGGFMLTGGHPLLLFQISELIVVLGFTLFSLLAIYRGDFIAFIPDAINAFFIRPEPCKRFAEIAECGRRYAITSGIIAFTMGMIRAMNHLGEEIEFLDRLAFFGYRTAYALSGIFMAAILSELIFGFLIKIYQEEGRSTIEKRKRDWRGTIGIIILALIFFAAYYFASTCAQLI